MLNVPIDRNDYESEINILKSYYTMKGKNEDLLIVRNPDHTIRVNRYLNPLFGQYLVSCFAPMLNPNQNCMMIAGFVWNERKVENNTDKLQNWRPFARAFNALNTAVNYNALKAQVTKSDIVLPDFLYFFEKSRSVAMANNELSKFADEFSEALQATIITNNQITPNLIVYIQNKK